MRSRFPGETGSAAVRNLVTELAASDRFPEPPAPKLMEGYTLIRQTRWTCFASRSNDSRSSSTHSGTSSPLGCEVKHGGRTSLTTGPRVVLHPTVSADLLRLGKKVQRPCPLLEAMCAWGSERAFIQPMGASRASAH